MEYGILGINLALQFPERCIKGLISSLTSFHKLTKQFDHVDAVFAGVKKLFFPLP